MITEKELRKFYTDWCKKTSRGGSVLVTTSIKELLMDFSVYYEEKIKEQLQLNNKQNEQLH